MELISSYNSYLLPKICDYLSSIINNGWPNCYLWGLNEYPTVLGLIWSFVANKSGDYIYFLIPLYLSLVLKTIFASLSDYFGYNPEIKFEVKGFP